MSNLSLTAVCSLEDLEALDLTKLCQKLMTSVQLKGKGIKSYYKGMRACFTSENVSFLPLYSWNIQWNGSMKT